LGTVAEAVAWLRERIEVVEVDSDASGEGDGPDRADASRD
jgi:hypothetical protein